jgi:hypothetical protein
MRSTLLKLFLVPAIAAAAAFASQTANAERVNVPFSFSAMGKTFPAGTYDVHEDLNGCFVTLRQEDGTKSLTSVLGPGVSNPDDSRVVLRFNVTGEDHVLDSIQLHAKITSHMTKHRHTDQERIITGE